MYRITPSQLRYHVIVLRKQQTNSIPRAGRGGLAQGIAKGVACVIERSIRCDELWRTSHSGRNIA